MKTVVLLVVAVAALVPAEAVSISLRGRDEIVSSVGPVDDGLATVDASLNLARRKRALFWISTIIDRAVNDFQEVTNNLQQAANGIVDRVQDMLWR
ncbi:uncharacterized protein LOC118265071 isoform X2 [Spodoptera frugiperda]|uniref:Uncharacterized protein LOC118265071 isoform X2 n=1 Tax=Spodoptera frugiperda TaxID=7108 RepID=A0A9R0CYE6_SPOFR|nr:uncharacterized protein LOC118265071 isoform X2 [Spodoptera frugiperda]XP_050561646.1 uncharacterized protein LOC118265071 isoform X2 [Spodoptera frugiperda]